MLKRHPRILWSVVTTALWLVLWLSWELGKDVVFGWINQQIAQEMGLKSISIEEILPVVTAGLPIFILFLVAIVIVSFAYRLGRHHESVSMPVNSMPQGSHTTAMSVYQRDRGLQTTDQLLEFVDTKIYRLLDQHKRLANNFGDYALDVLVPTNYIDR